MISDNLNHTIAWSCLTCGVEATCSNVPRACPACMSEHDDRHGPHATRYRWTLEISVAANWVADGIDLSDPNQRERMLEKCFPYLREGERSARMISEPNPEAVATEQGYRSAAHKAQERGK